MADTLPPIDTASYDTFQRDRWQEDTDARISSLAAPPVHDDYARAPVAPATFGPSADSQIATLAAPPPDPPAPEFAPPPVPAPPTYADTPAGQATSSILGGAPTPPSVTTRDTTPRDPNLVVTALNEAEQAGIDPALFVAQIDQESHFDPNAGSSAGARGIAQIVPRFHPGVDPTDPRASLKYAANLMANLIQKHGGDVTKALVEYNGGGGAVSQWERGTPYGESKQYVDRILSAVASSQANGNNTADFESLDRGLADASGTPLQAPKLTASSTSQFGDPQLTAEEAYAACGPAAAVRFAQAYGRNPTLREATDLAKGVGWTSAQGMAGLDSEKALMDKLGVPVKLVRGADWQTFATEAQTGNPVTISTPGHYFMADGYDPTSGKFHVGRSGLDLKGGAEWMSPADMERLMGTAQGGLLADNPQVPAPSHADQESNPLAWLGRQKDALLSGLGEAKDQAVDAVSSILTPAQRAQNSAPPERDDYRLESAVQGPPSPPRFDVYPGGETGLQQQEAARAGMGLEPGPIPPVKAALDTAGSLAHEALPGTWSDAETLARATPDDLAHAREVAARTKQLTRDPSPVTDADVVGVLKNDQIAFAYAGTHVPLEGGAGFATGRRTGGQPAVGSSPALDLSVRPASDVAPARQPGESQGDYVRRTGLLPDGQPAPSGRAVGDRPQTKVEQALDSGLVLPTNVLERGPAQILGPSGEVLSTVARDEIKGPFGRTTSVTGVVRSEAGAAHLNPVDPETAARLPNLAKMAPGMPDVQATIIRAAQENADQIDKVRRGVITHQELIEDLAPKVGMTAQDFLKTAKPGKAYTAEELLALRSAVVQKQTEAAQLAQEITDAGGVAALSPEQKANAVKTIVDAARLQVVARGGAAEAGRALNQQKIVIEREMAQAITGGNEKLAAARDAQLAQAKLRVLDKRIAQLEGRIGSDGAEQATAGVQAAQRAADGAPTGPDLAGLYRAEANAENKVAVRQFDSEMTARDAAQQAETVAQRKAAQQPISDAFDDVTKAYVQELRAEDAAAAKDWERRFNAFQAEADKRAAKAAGAQGEGERAWLEAQRKAAANEARIANQRAEQAWNAELRVRERQQAQAARALDALGGTKVTDKVLQQFVELQRSGDPMATAKFLRGLAQPSWLDRFALLRYASMLSSTATHLTNAMGNTIQLGLDVGLKPLAVGLDAATSAITGGARTRYLGEITPQLQGMAQGLLAGAREAKTILATGITPQQASKLDVAAGFGSGNRYVDFVAEAPLRALQAADAIFRGSAMGGQVRALAERQAIREGYTGAARADRARFITQNLTEFPQLMQEANQNAARVVLQESRQEIAGMTRSQGAAGAAKSLVLPFVKTPYNIAAQGAGMTPAGFLGALKAGLDGNRGEAVDRAARAAFGTAVLGTAVAAGANGYLTGPRPKDPKDVSTLPPGWQPWSVRVPDGQGGARYFGFQNLGPIGVPLAMAAVATEAARQGQPIDPARMVGGFGKFMVDQTFLQGLSQLVDTLEQPERYAENFTEGIVSPSVPYSALQRQVERAIGMADRDPHGALEALMVSFAPTAGLVPARQDSLGKPVQPAQTGGAAFLAPVRFNDERDTPTLKALRAADVGIPAVPKALSVPNGQVDLTPAEQRQYNTLRGQFLEEAVGEDIATPRFQNLNDQGKAKRLKQLVEHADARAKTALLQGMPDDDFRSRRDAGAAKKAPQPFVVGAR